MNNYCVCTSFFMYKVCLHRCLFWRISLCINKVEAELIWLKFKCIFIYTPIIFLFLTLFCLNDSQVYLGFDEPVVLGLVDSDEFMHLYCYAKFDDIYMALFHISWFYKLRVRVCKILSFEYQNRTFFLSCIHI